MLPFEDLVKGNPSIEMMKQVIVTAKKRPEFPAAFNVEPVSVFRHFVNTFTHLSKYAIAF